MKILITRKLLNEDLAYIKDGLDKQIKGRYEFLIPEVFDEESLIQLCSDADIFLGPYVSKSLLEHAKKLKLIQVPWTGMDTFDFDAVRGSDIIVCNTHTNADSVAEIGFALTLDLIKKISYHDRKMRVGNWNRDEIPLSLKSKMIKDSSVCILGCGNIGYRVAKLFNAFGAHVSCVDDYRDVDKVIEIAYSSLTIKKAVKRADIIVCCLPLTNETKDLLNKDIFDDCDQKPYLINISRAAIVNENDLYSALLSGQLSGYASDVWWKAPARGETESYPSLHNEFWKLDNVVLSPHRAGFVDGCFPHLDGAIDNIIRFHNNVELTCIVDINRGY